MRLAEDLLQEARLVTRRDARWAVALAAVIFFVHSAKVKIDKLTIGGSELVFSDAHVIKGSLGMLLVYLVLVCFRSFCAIQWATRTLDPNYHKPIEDWPGVGFYTFGLIDLVIFLFEFFLVTIAIRLCWPDMLALASGIWLSMG